MSRPRLFPSLLSELMIDCSAEVQYFASEVSLESPSSKLGL